jgi:hypothetical protein
MNDETVIEFDQNKYSEIDLRSLLFNQETQIGNRNIRVYFTSFFLFNYPDIHSFLMSYSTYRAISDFVVYSLSLYVMEIVSLCLFFTSSSSSLFCLCNIVLMVLASIMALRKSRKLSSLMSTYFSIIMFDLSKVVFYICK